MNSDTQSERFSAADLAFWRPSSDCFAGEKLEDIVLHALSRSHSEPSILRVLPILLSNAAEILDWKRLCEEAEKRSLGAELGFITQLAGALGGDARLASRVDSLVPAGRLNLRPYFPSRGAYSERLAAERTPPLARKWGFLMNMEEEVFRSAFEKHRAAI